MSLIEPIDSLDRVEPVTPVYEPAPVDAVQTPVEEPYATHASSPTGYDRWPAALDPAAASIAAAASAQHLKSFWQGVPPRERRR